MQVVIIGTGNVAHVLGHLLKKGGHSISQVFGRTKLHAGKLAEELESVACYSWQEVDRTADLYLVALADKALYGLSMHLRLQEQLVVHTAGSVSADVLNGVSVNYGVLYPLQSLRAGMPVLTQIPLLITGSNAVAYTQILQVARSISQEVVDATDEQRLKYHVAAVFINNFTNHLYNLVDSYCAQENIRFNALLPLAVETAERLQLVAPRDAVTGPAVRNDEVTIEKHLALLDKYPVLQTLYRELTYSIREWQKTSKSSAC